MCLQTYIVTVRDTKASFEVQHSKGGAATATFLVVKTVDLMMTLTLCLNNDGASRRLSLFENSIRFGSEGINTRTDVK
jgi:hypothetical protein